MSNVFLIIDEDVAKLGSVRVRRDLPDQVSPLATTRSHALRLKVVAQRVRPGVRAIIVSVAQIKLVGDGL